MTSAPTRRASREAEKKKSGLRWAALGAAAFIAIGGGGLFWVTQNGSQDHAVPDACDSTRRVALVTDQAMAGVLSKKPVNDTSCIQLDVHTESSAQTTRRAATGTLKQPLWIPDSSTRLPADLSEQSISLHTESLASSPTVVAGHHKVDAGQTWSGVLSDDSTRMGNPERDGSAHLALLNVASEISHGKVDQSSAAQELTTRAQTQGVNGPVLTPNEMLEAVKNDGGQAIVSEQDYMSYTAQNSSSDLAAGIPKDGTSFLDFPLLASKDSLENNDAVRTAADEINEWLATDEGKKALADHHLRTPDGALEPSAVSKPTRLPAPDKDVATTVVQSYRNQAAPMNALVALDASGSMGTKEPNGQTRWDSTIQTLMLGSQLFPARDSMGVWLFSDDLDGKNPYKELVPTRGMEDVVDGRSQREILQESLAGAEYKKRGQTDLYETALAAFRDQQKNYKEGQLNIVLLISDGAQENYTDDSMALEELTSTLQAEQDPSRPVVIVSLGITQSADAQALSAISESTGGSYHPATTPEQLQAAFVEALSADDSGAGQAQKQGAAPDQR